MRIALLVLILLLQPLASFADFEPNFIEYKGEFSLSSRIFPESPLYSGQQHNNYSLSIEPEVYAEWSNNSNFVFKPFYRFDNEDSHRTHFDLREMQYSFYEDDWEANLGIGQVFWGVTESKNLVDIINQFDVVDDPLLKTKLGQPLFNVTLIRESGYFDFFILPYFRERTNPGKKGRLRIDPHFIKNSTKFEGGSQWTPELSMRWSNSYNNYDISLHSFIGYSRAPSINIKIIDGVINYVPNYQRIRQIGGTLQNTLESTLLKLEWIAKDGEKDSSFRRGGSFSSVIGLEHTLFQSFGDNGDLGFLFEYNFDSRKDKSPDVLQDDIFMAARFSLNDSQNTEILFGSIFDLDGDGQIYQLDFGQRLNDSLNLNVKGAIYQNGRLGSNLYILRQDSWFEVSLKQYF